MQRFYRKKPTEQEVRGKSSEIAIKEVDSFHQSHSRYPNKNELDEISQNVFDQLKRELESAGSEADEIDLGPEEPGSAPPDAGAGGKKSVLELRKEKRAQASSGQGGRAPQPSANAQGPAAQKLGRGGQRGLAKKGGGKQQPSDEMAMDEQGLGPEDEQMPMPEGEDAQGGSAGGSQNLEELEERLNRENVKKLTGIDELASLESELSEQGGDEFDLVDKELEGGSVKCPKCSNPAESLVYCPECGDAFCDHCAKKIEALTDSVKYTCAKCGAEFKKKKSK